MTNVARLLRVLLPVLAASATVAATALPATASPSGESVAALGSAATGGPSPAGEWWLTTLHEPAAARVAHPAGKGVTVAVLSTGVDATHPDLTGVVTAGPDLGQTGRTPGQPYWGDEGTAVASLIAGHGHDSGTAGIIGVAPGTQILSVPVTLEYDDPLNSASSTTGTFTTQAAAIARRLPAAIAAGIRYAVAHGATIIALPLDPGTLGPAIAGDPAAAEGSIAERSAVSFALARNVLLVAPAGDNGAQTNSVNYPAAYPGVLAVGATARNGQLATFSNTGSYVALTAPGSGGKPAAPVSSAPASSGLPADTAAGLTVAAPDGAYQILATTDMAAALAAGVAALIRARYPQLTAPEVAQALEHGTTAPPGTTSQPARSGWGHGQLDATAALTQAAAIAADHPASTPVPSPPHKASAPVTARPAVTKPAPSPRDPGHLLRSLVTALAVAAGALIACLLAALPLTRLYRRRTTGNTTTRVTTGTTRTDSIISGPSSTTRTTGIISRISGTTNTPDDPGTASGITRTTGTTGTTGTSLSVPRRAHTANQPRHARSKPDKPPNPPVSSPMTGPAIARPLIGGTAVTGPLVNDTVAGNRTVSDSWGGGQPASTGKPIWPTGPSRRHRPHAEPPWPPAESPSTSHSPGAFLPAQPAGALPAQPANSIRTQPAGALPTRPAGHFPPQPAGLSLAQPTEPPERMGPAEPTMQRGAPLAPWKQLPPWELSPADFAAPAPDDTASWSPASTTSPLYLWNPNATTGPLAIPDHHPDPDPDPNLDA